MRRGRHNPQFTIHNPQSAIHNPLPDPDPQMFWGSYGDLTQVPHILYAVNPKPREMRLLGGQKEPAATRAALGQEMEQQTTKLNRNRQS